MMSYTPSVDSPFSESEEEMLAADLLGVTRDVELDRFLGQLVRRAAAAAGNLHSPSLVGALRALAKRAVRRILPGVGRSLPVTLEREPTGQTGQLARESERLLGLEAEGLSPEDQEFTAARQLVRLCGAAASQAETASWHATPAHVAQQAMFKAAQRYAAGLLRMTPARANSTCGCSGRKCACHRNSGGTWVRQGSRVILHEV
jgi:hypothetical protein